MNAITERFAYPEFIKVDKELDEFYDKVSCLIRSTSVIVLSW